jgi:hypothetical protein
MQGLTTMAKNNLVEHMIWMEIKTRICVMDVCMVNIIIPQLFSMGASMQKQ